MSFLSDLNTPQTLSAPDVISSLPQVPQAPQPSFGSQLGNMLVRATGQARDPGLSPINLPPGQQANHSGLMAILQQLGIM